MMSKKSLYAWIVKLAAVFDKQIDKSVATTYVELLHSYSENELSEAFTKIIKTRKFFPKVAEIIEIMDPQVNEVDQAQMLANNIVDTVLRYGRYQVDIINSELTPVERYALMAIGGVEAICNINIEQLGTVRAQLRNSCKAAIVKEKIELIDSKRLENRRGMQKLDFNGVVK